jgi:Ala-tRNA(Pro) deacylase
MRVPQFLSEQDVPFETIIHAPAFTAQKRAKVLRFPGSQVAKTVMLTGPAGHFLAVLPATHQVDTEALGGVMGGAVRLSSSREITELFRDCEWGVLEPFGSLYGLSTVIDESLDANAFIVFEGHTHAQTIRMRCRHFEKLERPRRLRFAQKV